MQSFAQCGFRSVYAMHPTICEWQADAAGLRPLASSLCLQSRVHVYITLQLQNIEQPIQNIEQHIQHIQNIYKT